jgi:hypothetical protein
MFLALINGSWTAQVLYVAVKLGLADLLAEGLQPADALVQATATHPEALRRLLAVVSPLLPGPPWRIYRTDAA